MHLAVLAAAAILAASPATPPAAGWSQTAVGPDGGTLWSGRIPNTYEPWDTRTSDVYLPPGYDPSRRYPVLYLLHGLEGNPSEYWDSLHLVQRLDGLVASGSRPFVVVTPVGGQVVDPNAGEWAAGWEDFVVHDVVPWVDSHLSTIASPGGRALEGLCAGGYGAVDIGLRHPGVFGTLGSWEGYFTPFRDGPFVHATRAELAAHDPTLLVRREAAALRTAGVRFYVSVGGNHGPIHFAWTLAFARELGALRLQHELWRLPAAEKGHFWNATVPSALAYAAAGFSA
ncbi:MAG TPA: alpha/beta hydrolase-fold protein [Gaiellaceae bacterium]|nr:alpha/beta hydrolase-fold protein [Gaiellaceae bacterium]